MIARSQDPVLLLGDGTESAAVPPRAAAAAAALIRVFDSIRTWTSQSSDSTGLPLFQ